MFFVSWATFLTSRTDHKEWYRGSIITHLAPYVAGDRSLVIEVHHHVVPTVAPVSLAIDDFWQRARPAQLASVSALVLSLARPASEASVSIFLSVNIS